MGDEPVSDEPNVFIEARDQFLASISPKERALFSNCTSAKCLIEDIKKFDSLSKKKRWCKPLFTKIHYFSQELAPYFEIVGIVIQSNPEIAAIAWGAIRFILQLASNYATFFEKLANTLDRLGKEIPQYGRFLELLNKSDGKSSKDPQPEHWERFKLSLITIYQDLFGFFRSVALVFMKKSGGQKATPLVVADLFWKPFDVRFTDLLEKMKWHRKVIKFEILLIQYEQAKEAIEKLTEEQMRAEEERLEAKRERILALGAREFAKNTQSLGKETKAFLEEQEKANILQRLREWLHPPEFTQALERAQEIREEGTSEWLFKTPAFQNWSAPRCADESVPDNENAQSLLWVYGNPGSGKTVIAAATVEELRDSQNKQVFYFFFRWGASEFDTSMNAYRALLAQVLQTNRHDQNMLDKFAFVKNELSAGQLHATKRELVGLLQCSLESVGECYIILDAIDECKDNYDLVTDILQTGSNSNTKFLLFGRPNVKPLLKSVSTAQRLAVGRSNVHDIRIYCSKKLERYSEEGLLPLNADIAKLEDHLTMGADGMFLWARLMMEYMSSPALTPLRRVQIVTAVTMPEGLEKMYTRILDHVMQSDRMSCKLARWIIIMLAFSLQPLTENELRESLKVADLHTDKEAGDFPDFEYTIIMTCGGLLEVTTRLDPRYGFNVRHFQFVHLSVKEYFATPSLMMSNPLNITRLDSHFGIARACLQYLTFCLPAQPLSNALGQDLSAKHLDEAFPFSRYSALHWSLHVQSGLEESLTNEQPSESENVYSQYLNALSNFLRNRFVITAWIEACYTFRTNPKTFELNSWFSSEPNSREMLNITDRRTAELYQLTHELSADLKALEGDWGAMLAKNPSSIWEETSAFTPSKFIAYNSATRVHSIVDNKPPLTSCSSRYLCKISEVDSAGRFMGVLSIWPSRKYEQKIQDDPGYFYAFRPENHVYFSEWTARYEIWMLADCPKRALDLRISLDRGEILLHVKQQHDHKSEWKRSTSERWKIQFPASISPTCSEFVILRDVFSIERLENTFGTRYLSTRIDFSFDRLINNMWSAEEATGCQDTSTSSGNVFRYHLTFSPNRRYLFFLGHESLSLLHFAMFELDVSDVLKVTLLNYGAEERICRSKMLHNSASFHPAKALLAFTCFGALFLWAFRRGNKKICSPIHSDDPSIIRYYLNHTRESTVKFSACGKYFVASQVTGSRDPTIQPLGENLLNLPDEPGLEYYQAYSGPSFSSPTSANSACLVRPPRLSLNEPSNAIGISGTLNVMPRALSTGIQIEHRSERVDVGPSDRGLQHIASGIELTRLPNWNGLSSSTATVLMPQSIDEMVRIVLNKSAMPYYDMADELDEHLPTLIERDPRAIRNREMIRAGKNGPSIEGARDKTRKIEQSSSASMVDESSVPKKRFRTDN